MYTLGCVHYTWMEHEEAVKWYTKGAEVGWCKLNRWNSC